MCINTHAHTQARMHTNTFISTHTNTFTRTNQHFHRHKYTPTHSQAQTHTDIFISKTYINAHMQKTCTKNRIYICKHTQAHRHKHAQMHTLPHTYSMHTPSHTYTRGRSFSTSLKHTLAHPLTIIKRTFVTYQRLFKPLQICVLQINGSSVLILYTCTWTYYLCFCGPGF